MEPPKPTINKENKAEKDVKPDVFIVMLNSEWFFMESAEPFTYNAWLLHSLHTREGGWFIFVYSNKQCQCSGLWQTLNWIAIVINKLLLRHLFFFQNEAGKTNIKCCGDFISIAKVWMNSASPRRQLFQSILFMWRGCISLNTKIVKQKVYIHTSTVYAILIQYVNNKYLSVTFILVLILDYSISCIL